MTTNALSPAGTTLNLPVEATPERSGIESIASLDSIDTIYQLYQPRIFRFLLSSLRDYDLAQTLTQETFLRAWNARTTFRGECSIPTWLNRIAYHLLCDHTRTNRFRFWKKAAANSIDAEELAGYLPHPASSTESRLIAAEQVALLAETVATLSPRQRTVFLLRFVEELDLAQIAEVTGLPISTVKTHLYRGLAIIRARHAAPTKETL